MWDYRRSLADAVNRARTQKRFTKRYVAEKIGTDARTVSNIEKCESNTTLDVLCPLLELLEIDPREALCPTMAQESPAHFRFKTLIENCSEQEATALLSVCEAVLNTLRGRTSNNIENKHRACLPFNHGKQALCYYIWLICFRSF